jgi:aminopeptidase 2
MVTFEFPKEISQGSKTVLKCGFKGVHNDKMAGFYRSGYKDATGAKKYSNFLS